MDISYIFGSNLPLFAICLVIIFLSVRNYKVRRLESIYFLIFTALVLVLFVVVLMEEYSCYRGMVVLGTIFTSIGYIVRPVLLYVFILTANMGQKRGKWFYAIISSLLAINFIVYLFPLFFGVEHLSTAVFSYRMLADGTAEFVRGTTLLNYCSHLVSVLLLIALIYLSFIRFTGMHRRDGWVFIVCAVIILATVITEMLLKRSDLLNIVCGICGLVNYIFIRTVSSLRDPLTGLYNRETYYIDISKFVHLVNGVIQIDMNELKFLNDNFGHDAGDKALSTISSILVKSISPHNMCVYRLSGDEFLLLMFQGNKVQLDNTVKSIKVKISQTEYSIAIGSYFIDKKSDKATYDQAFHLAEEQMYKDKADFYQKSGHDRRGRSIN